MSKRTDQLHIRISPEEKVIFEKYCDWAGYHGMTDYLLKHIRECNRTYRRVHGTEVDPRQMKLEMEA